MKYQKYFYSKSERTKNYCKAMTYCRMNQEYQYILLRKEASKLKKCNGVDDYFKTLGDIRKSLDEEFPNLDISDSEMMDEYNKREKKLLDIVENPFTEYVKYVCYAGKK